MQKATLSALDVYYASLFRIDPMQLWRSVTARAHGERLEDYPGYYVAWRGEGLHVSTPPTAGLAVIRALESQSVEVLQRLEFWEDLAARRDLRVIGPSTHAYLDVDPGPGDGVVPIDENDLASLRGRVDEADWDESGWNDGPAHTFGLYENGVLVAASNLNSFHDQPRDIGVVVARGWRARGLSGPVARHAASRAIREHGFARWGARNRNVASLAASHRLGFQQWCFQLAVR